MPYGHSVKWNVGPWNETASQISDRRGAKDKRGLILSWEHIESRSIQLNARAERPIFFCEFFSGAILLSLFSVVELRPSVDKTIDGGKMNSVDDEKVRRWF